MGYINVSYVCDLYSNMLCVNNWTLVTRDLYHYSVCVVSQTQVILWLEWKIHKFTPCQRHVWDLWDTQVLCYNECYRTIMNTDHNTISSEVANLLQYGMFKQNLPNIVKPLFWCKNIRYIFQVHTPYLKHFLPLQFQEHRQERLRIIVLLLMLIKLVLSHNSSCLTMPSLIASYSIVAICI